MSSSILLSHPLSPHLHLPKPKFHPPKFSCLHLKNDSLRRASKFHFTDAPRKLRKLVLARVAETEVDRDEASPLVGEDSAQFVLSTQKISSWVYFTVVLGVVLYVLNVAWIDNSTGFGKVFIDAVSSVSGSPEVSMLLLIFIFALVHSGLASLRDTGEKLIGERAFRVLFAGLSLPLAVSTVVYFINHRYDGVQLWQLQGVPALHELLWFANFVSFFFLYPSTFNLLEVAAVDKPKMHLWETGIMRITRHPQIFNRGYKMETSCAYTRCTSFTRRKELPSSSYSPSAAQFYAVSQHKVLLPHPTSRKLSQHLLRPLAAAAKKDDTDQSTTEGSSSTGMSAKGSGTTARGRRLLKVREEKRKRDQERLHDYPAWAKVLEDACKNDSELRAVLGDSIGNPDLMRKRVEERVRTRGRNITKSKSGSVLAFKVSFRDFNPLDSYIWFELYGSPSDRDVDLLGSVIQSWYVMGRLGAFNTANLQLANASMEHDPLYDADKGFKVMPSSFHDISDVEFQDNWGRVWVDLGTADIFSIDVLLNCLTVLSSEYLGIQQVVFGGRRLGDWEEGMTSTEFGYKSFKI